ncbi:type III-A CRISPR-associated protein Csm2 [Desulfatirhabdium butyrativorans]|uniref:type III-A CRISPR-associated protein Csm2 n=1 Tax=Desulfatirhabdium butyrativorans TaxID=340467 RepID=UPI00040E299A|nr:type III-A CRISPR-associated protein Csm2 [Desulfatirhabdium butyrativorans]
MPQPTINRNAQPGRNPYQGSPDHGRPQQGANFAKPTDQDLKAMLDGKNPKGMVDWAERIAKKTLEDRYNPLTTSQIRNIYGTVKKLEMTGNPEDVLPKLILLKPKLAYVVGRNSKVEGLKILRDVLGSAIDLVAESIEPRFQNFCRFFEAILAYHKAEGGK